MFLCYQAERYFTRLSIFTLYWLASLTRLLPESVMRTTKVDEILWCDHSNETSSAVLSHGTFYILGFYKNEIKGLCWILILGTL